MKSCDEMVESLLKRRVQYFAEKERKRKIYKRVMIAVCCVCLMAALGLGIWKGPAVVEAFYKWYPRRYMKDGWFFDPDAEPNKTIESDKVGLDKDSVQSSEKGTETLTYEITEQVSKENPVDIYLDSDQNQYRYNQSGELEFYQANSANEETLPLDQEPCTEEEAIRLAAAYLYKLFGERVEGFTFDSVDIASSVGDRHVDRWIRFTKNFGIDGFIEGASANALVRATGDLSIAYISLRELNDEFDPSTVEKLSWKIVADQVVPIFEANVEKVLSSSIVVDKEVFLDRCEEKFCLRVGLSFSKEGEDRRQNASIYYEPNGNVLEIETESGIIKDLRG